MIYDASRTEILLAKVHRSKEDMGELIALNEGLVYTQLIKFGLPHDDEARSIGLETLYRAICSYKSQGSTKLSTYATVCIYNRLGSYVRTLKTKINQNTISYDMPFDDSTTLLTYLESPLTADGAMLDDCGVKIIKESLDALYSKLKNPVHRKIVALWIYSKFKLTQSEIAEQTGYSQTYVSQILNKFRSNLKDKLKGV